MSIDKASSFIVSIAIVVCLLTAIGAENVALVSVAVIFVLFGES